MFDVSHMGEFLVRGDRAVEFVDAVTTNDVAKLAVGQVHYSTILYDSGTIVDDCLVYRFADHVMMVVNASNREKDLAHISKRAPEFGVTIEDISDRIGLLAVQGPQAEEILATLTDVDLPSIKYYHFTEGDVAGMRMIVSRTGYTGEDGFEIGVAATQAESLWNALVAAGVKPAGLGARDTLRLEAGMNLYGQDMDESVNPLDAGLAWTIDLVSERDFVGKAALQAKGQNAQFVGLILREKGGVLRAHQKVIAADGATGEITSGTFSPTMQQAIALARVPLDVAIGDTVHVEIRDKVRECILRIGYDSSQKGFDGHSCGVMVAIGGQTALSPVPTSPDPGE